MSGNTTEQPAPETRADNSDDKKEKNDKENGKSPDEPSDQIKVYKLGQL